MRTAHFTGCFAFQAYTVFYGPGFFVQVDIPVVINGVVKTCQGFYQFQLSTGSFVGAIKQIFVWARVLGRIKFGGFCPVNINKTFGQILFIIAHMGNNGDVAFEGSTGLFGGVAFGAIGKKSRNAVAVADTLREPVAIVVVAKVRFARPGYFLISLNPV